MQTKNSRVDKYFDPVRGEPPEDCDVLGWSCCYEAEDDRKVSEEHNAMMMAAGETPDVCHC